MRMKIGTSFKIVFLLTICFLGVLFFQNVSWSEEGSIDSFSRINCDTQKNINGVRYFFIHSRHGFIYDSDSSSPLTEKFPEKVKTYGPSLSGSAFINTIVIQKIPTKHLSGKTLEGGIFRRLKSDIISLFVDNSLTFDVYFIIDDLKPTKIPALSQKWISIREGLRKVKVSTVSDNTILEAFEIRFEKYRDSSGEQESGYYIYNILKNNSYEIVYGRYQK